MSRMTTMRKETRKKARRANKRIAPVASDARESAAKYTETALDWAAPRVEAARDWAGPKVEPTVTKVKDDVLPKVAGAVTAALVASEPAREEAKSRGTAAVAALKGEIEPPKPRRKRRFRKLLLLFGVVGAAVAGWKAWAAQNEQPEPWAAPADFGTTGATHPATDDAAGASPDEALADTAEESAVAAETDEPTVTTETVSAERAKAVKKEAEAGRKKP